MTHSDLPEAGRGRTGEDQLDPSLVSLDGLFEQFPGPVLVITQNGLPIGSNSKAAALVQAYRAGSRFELNDAVESALAGKVGQINPLILGDPAQDREFTLAIDLLVLPWADGTAALLLGRDVTLERSLRQALIESRDQLVDSWCFRLLKKLQVEEPRLVLRQCRTDCQPCSSGGIAGR